MKLGPIDLKRREKMQTENEVPNANQVAASVISAKAAEQDLDGQRELENGSDPSTLQDHFSRIKGTATKTLSPLGRAGKFQFQTFKEEGKDLKELLASKDIVIYKTDAVAVLLRKLGHFFEFLDEYNRLVSEGYAFVYSEPVESFFEIPITGIKTKLGKLYYFHHQKYADNGADIVPDLSRHEHGHAIERARDTDDIPLPLPADEPPT